MDSPLDNPKKWGLGLAGCNVLCILIAMGTVMRKMEVLSPEASAMPYWLWIVGYILHLVLNVYLFLCLRKSDRVAILVWVPLTMLLFIFRIGRSEISGFIELIITLYILVALVLLPIVYLKLGGKKTIIRVVVPAQAAVTPVPAESQAANKNTDCEAGSKTRAQTTA